MEKAVEEWPNISTAEYMIVNNNVCTDNSCTVSTHLLNAKYLQ